MKQVKSKNIKLGFISLYIIQNLDFMSQEKTEKGIYKLKIAMYAILIFSSLMLFVYCVWFWGKPSDDSEDWGSFGSYFGSITGLLAFAGVLYTAWQSEQRAKIAEQRAEKAEEESKNREERDMFFKLLDLLQKKLDLITFQESGREFNNGLDAIKEHLKTANNIKLQYFAYRKILDNNEDAFNNSFILSLITIYKAGYYEDLKNKITQDLKDGIIVTNKYFIETYSDELNEIAIESRININLKYDAYKFVGDELSNLFGFNFEFYCKTLYNIIKTIDDFSSNNKYYMQFIRTLLSRNELALIFYNVMSSRVSNEIINILIKHRLFDGLDIEEFSLENSKDRFLDDIYKILDMKLA